MLSIETLHEKILYPVCRVRGKKAGGSGVLIYSQPDPKNEKKYINIILTCEHVVTDNIALRDKWDTVLKKDVKRDTFEEVTVEIFDYESSSINSSNSTPGKIIAYDSEHDIAAIRLNNHKPLDYVANVYPRDKITNLRIGDRVWVCGCSLGHDPFPSPGTLTYLREIIDQKAYLMANAPAIFGNSGGGLFHEETESLLGLTSRVTISGLQDVQTWMEFSSHPERLYEFFEKQELQFVYDPRDDYYKAMERRAKRREEAIKAMFWETHKEIPTPDIQEETGGCIGGGE